jgi:hypothetical protein
VVSRGDQAFSNCGLRPVIFLTEILASLSKSIGCRMEVFLLRALQRRTERRQARLRRALLKQDQRQEEIYAFSGPSE